jgi:transposase
MPLVHLTEAERRELERTARTTRDARVLRRAQVLLDLDRGEDVERVRRRYQVSRSTVYNWVARFSERGPSEAALRDRPRPGRPARGSRAS